MINCEKCGKDNQDHYKFCLGCGAELSKKGDAPKPAPQRTPPQGVPAVRIAAPSGEPVAPAAATNAALAPRAAAAAVPAGVAPIGRSSPSMQPAARALGSTALVGSPAQPPAPAAVAPAPAASQATAGVECPQCGHKNPKENRFCAACGYNLSAVALGKPVSSPPAAAVPTAATGHPVRLTALRADGSEAGSFDLPDVPQITVGRDSGGIFAGDSYLSPRHATFTHHGRDILVRDEASLNGVYFKLKPHEPQRLQYSDVFRIGQEIVRFEELKGQPASTDGVQRLGSPAKGYIGRLSLVIGRDVSGNSFPVPERGLHCGRERGDVLFSEDGYVSGLHCRIARGDDGTVYLTDVGSSNGTFLRLHAERALVPGDILLMGQQLFRVDF